MDGLKPYPAYKDSGLPWLGQVPEHWGSKRGKVLFHKVVRPVRAEDGVITCFRDGVVTLRKNRRLRGFTEAIFELGYQGIRKGDLVIHAMDAFAGAIGVSDSDGKGTPVYAVCQPQSEANSNYYAHLVREMARTQWIQALSRGIRERSTDFRFETFGRQFLPVPPSEDQAAIVRYLDHATRKIDQAIRAKRKIIALLNEQKQAIIHRAVTRGLDPDVPLKDSGIPWLGQIPAHWQVWPLRRCVSIRSGDFADPARVMDAPSKTHAVPVIGGNGVMGFTDRHNSTSTTIVIGRVGALCGNVHVITGTAWITDNALRLTRVAGFDASYLAAQLRVMNLNRLSNANAQPLITGGVVKSQRVAMPPVSEQEAIASSLQSLSTPDDRTARRVEREISLLREYRTRLIADVVTGKLDVRVAASRLPDLEPDEALETVEVEDDEEVLEETA